MDARGAMVDSGAMAGGHEALGNGFDDLLVDFIDAEIAFDEDDAVRFAGGDFAVFLPGAAVEGVLLLLEAVFVFAGLLVGALVAMAGAGEAGFEGGQQQQGEIGLQDCRR